MTKSVRFAFLAVLMFSVGCASQGGGGDMGSATRVTGDGKGIKIVKPQTAANVGNKFEVCMEASGYTVEPASKGVNPGAGHHHLIIDVDLPPAGQPIPKDSNHIHMGDGSTCKTIELSDGMHRIQALFAKGNHVPYDPPVTDSIVVFVQ